MLNREDLNKRFNHHPPKTNAVSASHDMVRMVLREATEAILSHIPDSREASVFATKMEEAMFWANAAIARNQ